MNNSLLVVLAGVVLCNPLGFAAGRPNVVLIYADDLGIGDVGAYGGSTIPTPYIDSIADNGVLCKQGYVTALQCGPSRAGLLTGRYQQKFGFEFNFPIKRSFEFGTPLSEVMIFSRLKKAGYRTGVVGKWHMGRGEGYCPWERDVDYFYGVLNGTSWYFPPFDWASKYLGLGDPTDIHRNDEIFIEKDSDYITEAFARECTGFIQRNKNKPFFLYAPFTAPHVPILYRERHVSRVAHIKDKKRREYAALVVALDDAVGRILDELKEQGVWGNTLLFFISDNGASSHDGGSNAPFKGYKGSLWEGGIRTPYLVQWPEKLPVGKIYEDPVSTLDVAATIVVLAGQNPDVSSLDGVNLIPFLTSEASGAPHEFLFYKQFAWNDSWGVRHGDWMLMGRKEGERLLYNLSRDPSESENLAMQYPELVDQLHGKWKQWNETTEPVSWDWKE
ncbi:sulfatase family protein [Tichowtungia aerotolerans]|uniref:Sulfatase-like hydrolase/transferase n=1 Tax=Tichowtungia aerotolerans TaxID=2697043 RepID=A0A6P1MDZ6_9BACT|nr:sulfatase-like hydrolase/transferase [Tichowtungia aerotolerans]QHI70784.1 sulfatase-like hydrolase/transferase [Tichowtungia aerotolerans]